MNMKSPSNLPLLLTLSMLAGSAAAKPPVAMGEKLLEEVKLGVDEASTQCKKLFEAFPFTREEEDSGENMSVKSRVANITAVCEVDTADGLYGDDTKFRSVKWSETQFLKKEPDELFTENRSVDVSFSEEKACTPSDVVRMEEQGQENCVPTGKHEELGIFRSSGLRLSSETGFNKSHPRVISLHRLSDPSKPPHCFAEDRSRGNRRVFKEGYPMLPEFGYDFGCDKFEAVKSAMEKALRGFKSMQGKKGI